MVITPKKKPAVTPRKTATERAKPVAAPKPASSAVPMLRKKELIERVVARSGIKKKDAKPTIEAMLAILGEALDKGEVLNLQPMGKVMVKRVIDKPNAKILVCRVRQRKENADGAVAETS